MGKQVAARSKENKPEGIHIERALKGANLHQQGSAVKITGFTSD